MVVFSQNQHKQQLRVKASRIWGTLGVSGRSLEAGRRPAS